MTETPNTPTGLPDCPFCDWDLPDVKRNYLTPPTVPPGLASVLGVDPLGWVMSMQRNNLEALERVFRQHYDTHPIEQWYVYALEQRKLVAQLTDTEAEKAP